MTGTIVIDTTSIQNKAWRTFIPSMECVMQTGIDEKYQAINEAATQGIES